MGFASVPRQDLSGPFGASGTFWNLWDPALVDARMQSLWMLICLMQDCLQIWKAIEDAPTFSLAIVSQMGGGRRGQKGSWPPSMQTPHLAAIENQTKQRGRATWNIHVPVQFKNGTNLVAQDNLGMAGYTGPMMDARRGLHARVLQHAQ